MKQTAQMNITCLCSNDQSLTSYAFEDDSQSEVFKLFTAGNASFVKCFV